MKLHLFYLFLFYFTITNTQAQSHTINGRITNAFNGETLFGVM